MGSVLRVPQPDTGGDEAERPHATVPATEEEALQPNVLRLERRLDKEQIDALVEVFRILDAVQKRLESK